MNADSLLSNQGALVNHSAVNDPGAANDHSAVDNHRAAGERRARLEQVAGRLATQVLLLATGPLLALATGREGRGQAAVGVAFAVVLPPLVGVGFGSAVRSLVSVEHQHRGSLWRAGIARTLLGGALGAAIVGAATVSVFDIDGSNRIGVIAAAATAGLSSFVDGLVSLRLVQGRRRQAVLARVLPVLAFAVFCTASFAVDGLTPQRYLLAYAALPVLRFAVIAAGHRRPPAERQPERPRWARSGRWGILHELSETGLAHAVVLAAGLSLGAAELGLLSVALTVSRIPNFIAAGVSDSDVTEFAAAKSGGRPVNLARRAQRVAQPVLAASIAIVAVGWFAIPIVFGSAFTEARVIAVVLGLATPATAAISYVSAAAVALGHPKTSTRIQLLLLVSAVAATAITAVVGGSALWAAVGFSIGSVMVGSILVRSSDNMSLSSESGRPT